MFFELFVSFILPRKFLVVSEVFKHLNLVS